jgi:hypothetical protein
MLKQQRRRPPTATAIVQNGPGSKTQLFATGREPGNAPFRKEILRLTRDSEALVEFVIVARGVLIEPFADP